MGRGCRYYPRRIFNVTQIFLFSGGVINAMAIKPILLMGNPVLYELSVEVSADEREQTKKIISDLRDTLENFRNTHGFGRAIAAVQIGVRKRIIFMKIGNRERIFINPKLEFLDSEQIELWDNCFSFPEIRVRVARYKRVKVSFWDRNYQTQVEIFTDDLSELIQHEHDHLDGILAVARAIDPWLSDSKILPSSDGVEILCLMAFPAFISPPLILSQLI